MRPGILERLCPTSVCGQALPDLAAHWGYNSFGGKFPTWLSPVQVEVLPITDRNNDYSDEIVAALKAEGVRCECDKRQEKTGFKVREAQLQKIPYMLVIGDKEEQEGTVSVRRRDSNNVTVMKKEEFIAHVVKEIKERARS